MTEPREGDQPAGGADPLAGLELWFARHGLTYFVPEERAAVREALRPRRALPLVAAVLVVAGAGGVALTLLSDDLGAGPALLLTLGGVAALGYAMTALRARPILAWALSRTFGSLSRLLPMMSRALPLLLLFVTFLFINAEVWQLAASLNAGVLWLTVLLFGACAVAFLLVRLPEEVDRVDDDVDGAFLTRACAGTPFEEPCARLLADPADLADPAGPAADPVAYAEVSGFERWNLILALLVIQAVQVLLLALGVFVFFLLFGALAMTDGVQLAWTGHDQLHSASWLPTVSVELLQVSVFLAAFSGLYLTVSTVVDDTYREQFFGGVLRELERAVGVRAVYRALRAAGPPAGSPTA
ncbi:MAG: hypothetical protein QM572_07605 [Nocardioides sp.]|uniref:hypothetical protein n=1 Tax=Nocardioides sp. TaxID=35761 RepID=UPI0039E47F0C